jgi:hypothetical protein
MPGTNWQPEEDERLLEFLANGISWKEISRALPSRSEGSCMKRYRNTLAKQLWEDPNLQEIVTIV